MDSSYLGEASLGTGRSGSSRRGKKSNSDKPRQPQRGLGVAQLEKIRLHNQMGCGYLPPFQSPYTNLNQEEDIRMQTTHSSAASSSVPSYSSSSTPPYGLNSNIMMGFGEMETTDIRYGGDSQSSPTARWNYSSGLLENQYPVQPSGTRHFFGLQEEDSLQKKRRSDPAGSSSQNSQSSDTQELDLELKLSL